MKAPPMLIFTNGDYSYTHHLVQGDNVIGSHLKEFTREDGIQIPCYALKIEIDKDLNMELEVMNTHFQTNNLEFGKFISEMNFRQIKPGRVYIAELGDTLGYKDTKIRLHFKEYEEENNIYDDIINAPTQVAPRIFARKDPAKNEDK